MKEFFSSILLILALSLLCVGCKRMGRGGELEEKYGSDSAEMYLYDELGIDPEQCKMVKISEDGEFPAYEVTTDYYELGKELTFQVFEAKGSGTFGNEYTYWDNDVKDCLFDAIYPQEARSRVFNENGGYSFWIDPNSFDEDIEATANALKEIAKAYEKCGIKKDMIPLMRVEGRFVDTERIDGVTVSSKYVDNAPKELIYQALFEMELISNINEISFGGSWPGAAKNHIKKHYLFWAMENGLEDICSRFSYEERREALSLDTGNKLYFAVVDGETTDESEEVYSDYKGNLSISSFYKLLKRQGWEVEGDWYHYKLRGIDGKEYEFGYDLCGLAADPVSSKDASENNYSRTFNNFYYICDGEKYRAPDIIYDGKVETRIDINSYPEVYRYTIKTVTGWDVTSTYKEN